jgi:rSAM/selenodomain-associated transferase 1
MPRLEIGVLAKFPVAGSVKTRLARTIGADRAAEIAAALLRDSLEMVTRVPRARVTAFIGPDDKVEAAESAFGASARGPVRWKAQGEGDLGARLARAARSIHAVAGAAFALIGTDAPLLSPARFKEAAAALDRVDVVLGPSLDGGYYLIAARLPHPTLFSGVPWSTADVAAVTRARARSAGLTLRELPALRDLDGAADLDPLLDDLLAAWEEVRSGRRDEFPRRTFREIESLCAERHRSRRTRVGT